MVQHGALADKVRKQPSDVAVGMLTQRLFNNLPQSGDAQAFYNPAEIINSADNAFRDNTQTREATTMDNVNTIDPTSSQVSPPVLTPTSYGGFSNYVPPMNTGRDIPSTETTDHLGHALNNYETGTGSAPTLEAPEVDTFHDGLPLGELQPPVRNFGATVEANTSAVISSKEIRDASREYFNKAMDPLSQAQGDDPIDGFYPAEDIRYRPLQTGRTASSIALWGGLGFPVDGMKITSEFGMRYHPVHRRNIEHHGIDIAARYGQTVYAAEAGVVSRAGYMQGYGNAVIIQHSSNLATLYGHGLRVLVREGETVSRGQAIMLADSTGVSTGNHLHFEVRVNGVAVNPVVGGVSNFG